MVQQADFVTAALQDCDPVLPGRLILGTPMIHEPTITVYSKAQHQFPEILHGCYSTILLQHHLVMNL